MIVAVLTFINSNFFSLTSVVVKGNQVLTDREIIQAAGLDKEKNIFQINFEDVSARLMEKHQIKGVVLKRKLPATVEIKLDERRPLLAVIRNNRYLLLNKSGWVLTKIEKISDVTYPILRDAEVKIIDNKIKLTKHLQISLQYLTKIERKFLSQIDYIKFDEKDNITLRLKSGIVKFGHPVKIDYKVKLFNQIYHDLEEKQGKIEYINLKYYQNPVVRFK
nr:FtsQ-type POTRA domain-containing protein [Sporohalobacter salinus]